MTDAKTKLEQQINEAEERLDLLKSKYITLYGFRGLKVNDDGSVSELPDD